MPRAKVNKSERIREAIQANPDVRPAVVVNLLRAGGIDVSSSLVSKVKARVAADARSSRRKVARRGKADKVGAADNSHLRRERQSQRRAELIDNDRVMLEKVTGFLV